MKPATLTIPMILLTLLNCLTYNGYSQSDQQSSRDACQFEPTNIEDLTTDQEMIRAGNQMDLQIARLARELETRKTSRSASSGVVLKVPIVVHLVYGSTTPGTLANLTDNQVETIINQVNANFRHASGNTYANAFSGVDVGIELCFATEDPNGNPTNGIDRHHDPVNSTYNKVTKNVQNLYQWPKDDYLNIYYVDYADANITIPYGVESIVCWGYSPRVMTHEVGHFFGLYHIYQGGCINGNCDVDGDKVCDTPPTTYSGPSIPICPPSAINTCNSDIQDTDPRNPYRSVALGGLGDVNDLWENYMYTSLGCAEAFTQGQARRMRTVLLGAVVDLLRSPYKLLESTKCGPQSPVVRLANPGNQLCTSTGYYEQTITLAYLNPPSSGKINVNGQLFDITPDEEGIQQVSLEDLPADGNPVTVTIFFTSEPASTFTFPDLFIAPSLANCQLAPCEITQINLDFPPSCDAARNSYGAQFRIFYENAPPGQGANLKLYVNDVLGAEDLSYSSPEVLGIFLPADGQPANVKAQFTDNPACSLVVANMFIAPNPGCAASNTCSISNLTVPVNGQSACNPATNTYTQEVTVTYTNSPTTGKLNVNGQLFDIVSSPQTVTLSNLVANGNPVNVTASFSDNSACTMTVASLFTAPTNCEPLPCTIIDLSVPVNGQSTCNPNSNTYSQQVTVTYENQPVSGKLDVNGQKFTITSSPQTVTLIGLPSNGNNVNVTAFFDALPTCQRTEIDLFTAPPDCQCSIIGLASGSQSSCNSSNNTYSQEITVTYINAPATGKLVINNQYFDITTSPQTETLTNLIANGDNVNVTAYFSSNITCLKTLNNLFTAPVNCEVQPCSITSVTLGSQSSCDPSTNTYEQIFTLVYSNPPGMSKLKVNHQIFDITASPQVVTLAGLQADGNLVDLSAHFTANVDCRVDIPNFFQAPENCQPCSIYDITLGDQTPCNPQTNTFTQEVFVSFINPPDNSLLSVNGQDVPIGSSPQKVTLTGLVSSGNDLNVTASFTNSSCTLTKIGLIPAPFSCLDCVDLSFSPGINIPNSGSSNHVIQDIIYYGSMGAITEIEILDLDISHSYIGDLMVQLTSPEGTTVTLFDQPGIPGSIYGCSASNVYDLQFDDDFFTPNSILESTCGPTSPAINGAFQSKDLLAAFEGENPQGNWTLTITDKYPSSDGGSLDKWDLRICHTDAQCAIIDLDVGTQSSCTPFNNSYDQEIIVSYSNPPGDILIVNGQSFPITVSPQSINLTGLVADGQAVTVTAFFADDNNCILTESDLFMAPQNCEPCSFNSIDLGAQSACDPLTNTFSQTLVVSYSKAPSTGTLVINGQHFPITGSPQAVTLIGLPADNQDFLVEPSFSDLTYCEWLGLTLIASPSGCSSQGDCNTLAADDVSKTIPELIAGDIIITSTIQVGVTGTITDVDILNLDIEHTWVGDLYARLISPQGTSVVLFDQIGIAPDNPYGCSGKNLSLVLDDQSYNSVADLNSSCNFLNPTAVHGSYQPKESLSSFNGESPSGTWTLEIRDLYPQFDGGTLKNWSIRICTGSGGDCLTTSTLQLNASPIDPGVYSAVNITSKGTLIENLNRDNAFFRAQTSAMLEPQFEIQNGAELLIQIDPCICEKSQFAISATASSFWLGGGPVAWYPIQATGAPDAKICGDNAAAWAPETAADIDEFLHLVYATPVKATGIKIWETWNDVKDGNGFVTKIEVVDLSDNKYTIWQGTDDTPCGQIFEPNIVPTSFLIDEVIIHTKRLGYEQIDAVELTGVMCNP